MIVLNITKDYVIGLFVGYCVSNNAGILPADFVAINYNIEIFELALKGFGKIRVTPNFIYLFIDGEINKFQISTVEYTKLSQINLGNF